MRILLYSSSASDNVKADVMLLREVRNYDAVAFHELADPAYRDQGIKQSLLGMLDNMLLELISRAVVVLHPETEPALAVQVRSMCDLFLIPCLMLHELPEFPPEGLEQVDLFRAEFTGLHRRTATIKKKEVPMVAFANPVLEIDDNGEVIERPRTPREWFRDQQMRFRRWEERFNARYGQLLKNPVSRALQDERATPLPAAGAAPREYPQQTSTSFTTG